MSCHLQLWSTDLVFNRKPNYKIPKYMKKHGKKNIRFLRGKDRVSNRKIRSTTLSKDIGGTIKKLNFKYTSHRVRMQEDRWNRRATHWTPHGKTKKRETENEVTR